MNLSLEAQTIGLIVLGLAGAMAVGWFVAWLVSVPHHEMSASFDELKRKEDEFADD